MHKIFLIILVSLVISSCSSTSNSPYLTSEPIVVSEKLDSLWVSANDTQPLKYMSRSQRKSLSGNTLIINAEYLIVMYLT